LRVRNNNNILVTGGLGFIGSHFIRQIFAKESSTDISVINIDFMGYGANINNLNDIVDADKTKKRYYRFIQSNIDNKETLESIANGFDIDVIVNFAAETHVDRSISNPTAFVASNINGVISLLEFCRLHDVPLFVQISTDEVYGDVQEGMHLDEDSPLRPNSPYSASKASADLLTRAYNKTYGLKTIITRCSNNFGPNQFPEKIIPKAIIRSVKGLPIPIYGDGKQTREWIYVEDSVDAVLKVITKGRPGEIYNISSTSGISNIELVNKIGRLLHGINSEIQVQIDHVHDRPGHDRRYSLDCSKIKKEIGWDAKQSLDSGLEETIKWYINNDWWWRPLLTDELLSSQPWELEWKR
jgi:dTDP-glucose 4,6-dehydratase